MTALAHAKKPWVSGRLVAFLPELNRAPACANCGAALTNAGGLL